MSADHRNQSGDLEWEADDPLMGPPRAPVLDAALAACASTSLSPATLRALIESVVEECLGRLELDPAQLDAAIERALRPIRAELGVLLSTLTASSDALASRIDALERRPVAVAPRLEASDLRRALEQHQRTTARQWGEVAERVKRLEQLTSRQGADQNGATGSAPGKGPHLEIVDGGGRRA